MGVSAARPRLRTSLPRAAPGPGHGPRRPGVLALPADRLVGRAAGRGGNSRRLGDAGGDGPGGPGRDCRIAGADGPEADFSDCWREGSGVQCDVEGWKLVTTARSKHRTERPYHNMHSDLNCWRQKEHRPFPRLQPMAVPVTSFVDTSLEGPIFSLFLQFRKTHGWSKSS